MSRFKQGRSRVIGGAVLALTVTFAASACASQGKSGSTSSSSGDLSIGVGVPLSGDSARAGLETLDAVKIAVEEFNKAGGLNGHSVKVVPEDDQGEPQVGQTVAQKFCDDKSVIAVIGHYNSGVTLPASNVYQRCGLAEISPLSSDPAITTRGLKNIFRVGARDDYMGPAVAVYLAKNTKYRTISTIDDQSSYGVGLVQQFTKEAKKENLDIVKTATIQAGGKDFRTVLGTLPKSTQVIYFGGYPDDAALLAQQARQVGLHAVIAGGDGLYDPDFLKGKDAVNGAILTASAGNPTGSGATAAFIAKYKASYGQPDGYALIEYNAARLLLDALKSAGTINRQSVITELHKITYQPVEGGPAIKFNEAGDNVNAQVHIFVVKDLKFHQVEILRPQDFE